MRNLITTVLLQLTCSLCLLGTIPQYSSAASDRPSLKVGVILPLSGKVAEYGQAMQNGIELLLEERKAKRSSIQFIYEDVQYDPKSAVSAFNKLRTIDKVDLIYSFGVPLSKAVAPLAERYKIPLVAQSVDPTISKDAKYVIRFSNDTEQYSQELLKYIKAQNLRNIAIVDVHNAYINETIAALQRVATPLEKFTFVDTYELNQLDFRSTVTKLRRKDFDAIAVFLGPGQISRFYKQLAEQKLNLPTFGANWFESTSEIQDSEGTMNGAVFCNNIVKPAFAQRYIEHYQSDSQITFAAYAYEFAALLIDVFTDSVSLTNIEVLERLKLTETRTGNAIGSISYRETSSAGKFFEFPLANKMIRDNLIVVLE